MLLKAQILFTALFSLASGNVLAWSDHYLVTQAAIAPLKDFQMIRVKAEPIQKVLADLGYSDLPSFLQSHQWNRNYTFDFRLGETDGQNVFAASVLAKYSDEPDWGMDKELFSDDQYPELWQPELSMMGGKSGTPSQAFRHMYWRELDFWHPVLTFKLPVDKLFATMGEAHRRSQIFIDLARQAIQKGHPYWGVRFTANALHYLEDLAQPFHSAQSPTKAFIQMPIERRFGSAAAFLGFVDGILKKNVAIVQEITNVIAYYHYAFEDYVARMMDASDPASDLAVRLAFEKALAGNSSTRVVYDGSILSTVVAMSHFSNQESARAGRACIAFFPGISADYATMKPEALLDEAWWNQVIRTGKTESDVKKTYFTIVGNVFSVLGETIRNVVTQELSSVSK